MKSHKEKILIATTSFPTNRNPSAGAFVENFSKAMSKYLDVLVVAPSAKKSLPLEYCVPGLRISIFRYAPKFLEVLAQSGGGIPASIKRNRWALLLVPLFFLGYFFKLLVAIRKVDYVQANWVFSGFVASVPCIIFRKKLIVTLHGEDSRKLERKVIHRLMFLVVMKLSYKIVCVGDEMYKNVLNQFGKHSKKLTCITQGIDEILYSQEKIIRPSIFPIKLLIVSSLIPIKSVDHAIRAIYQLRQSNIDVELDVVGDGPLADELKGLVKNLSVDQSVKFHGAIAQSQLYNIYKESDVLLLCSKSEGRSSTIMEGMAAGLPIIASNVIGIREIIEDSPGALLYPYGSVDKLVEAINYLVTNGQLKNIGLMNRNYSKELDSSWDKTAKNYLALLTNGAQ